ncbi:MULTISPECIES: protein adenylyltransferase SelO [Cyanophyceae]|uniref:Protein nucleotidyltransferase YdiU n=1 Tax=Leptolyngbya subtilissima DQ-A4 TaxID=2933933 RepID=A0ABV0KC77_9CYAN|nr:YdiU family protein [Nodosilinea sp. FACHB-141]MBD2110843.1 YdiU family protein [Nodosilinea sp. FACHB-141]
MTAANPLLALDYLPALESLGDDYYDIVAAAEFPKHILRFRNDDVVRQLGLDPASVSDDDFIKAFGKFQGREPFLALRYHGYQFGEYNPFLGDGRGFLYGQVRGTDGNLYDFGTKGSGTTPYSRGGDGMLTLKGGVREVLAAEALHALGVNTSRAFSLVETGQALWRGDEPSPTRSSVLVRFSQSHIRFGTFERLEYHNRPDLIAKLLEHVIDIYYPEARLFTDTQERYRHFYGELCDRVARLAAQWMSVGFCHAVLNTDNMSITGESFDYGPFAFMDGYDPRFTAAYFDYAGRYSYGNQPIICQMNLKALQKPLKLVMPEADLEAALEPFKDRYAAYYQQRMLYKLGFEALTDDLASTLVNQTIELLSAVEVGYHDFFLGLTQQFSADWRDDASQIFSATLQASDSAAATPLEAWSQAYHRCLQSLAPEAMEGVASLLQHTNPSTVLLRPEIEAIWEPITTDDNWQPFYDLLNKIQHPFVQG